ncbi:MAG: acyl-CoA dehydrogenase family protein [Thermodesulfobacteriota bacterium]
MSDNGHIKGGGFLIEKIAPDQVTTPEDMSEEHRMILQTTWDFVEKEIFPHKEKMEKKDKAFITNLLKMAGELGLNSTDIPEAYGGLGLDKVATAVVCEPIGASGSFATTHGAHTGIGTLPIVFFGTEEQKRKYLPGLATGETIGAYALTEPSAGSDAMGGCKTKAVLSEDGRHYILNGQKIFITNAAWAHTIVTYAKVDGENFTSFIVERGFPGVSVGPEEPKLGIRGSSTCSVIFEDARVPVENVLHEIGKGHQVAFNILNVGRYKLAAATVGGCKATLKMAVAYAKVREQFGQPICQFGAIKEKLANMAILTYLNESMVHRTAGLFEGILSTIPEDDPQYGHKTAQAIHEYAIECSIDKVFGSEAVAYCVDECLQIHGGYGFIEEYDAERAYRDARIIRIYEGTNEINRLIVLGELMGRAMKNRLPLLDAAMKLLEEIMDTSPAKVELSDEPLAYQEHVIEQAKKAALMVASAAANKYGLELTKEQEVVTRISDMVIQVFALETGLLRAKKVIQEKGEEAARYHVDLVKAGVEDALPRIEAWAKAALAHVEPGEGLAGQLAALRKFTRYEPIDAITLKRTIADRVIQLGGYPL